MSETCEWQRAKVNPPLVLLVSLPRTQWMLPPKDNGKDVGVPILRMMPKHNSELALRVFSLLFELFELSGSRGTSSMSIHNGCASERPLVSVAPRRSQLFPFWIATLMFDDLCTSD